MRLDNLTVSEICPPSIQIVINEVAWAGTNADPSHEWIELYNPGGALIDLTGWRLVSSDGTPDISLSGNIPAGGYFLLERDQNATDITADLIYSGALADSGETLSLYDNTSNLIDTANGNGGVWPAGDLVNFRTMERSLNVQADSDTAWYTNDGITRNGLDFNEDPIWGTPKNSNAPTPTPSPTNTSTPTSTPTATHTPTFTPTITPTALSVRSVIINEVAWAGTASGLSEDEWIELYNTTNSDISLTGWSLKSSDGAPSIALAGCASVIIPSGGYYLLERDDDTNVDITADCVYTGGLSNSGETLTLYDPSSKVIDTANGNGGSWPAGSASTYGTMERASTAADSDSIWITNTGVKKNGKNANGGDILGTPKQSNSVIVKSSTATPEPTATPTFPPGPAVVDPRPILNEILARPGYDWNRDGRTDVFDEFIEIKNLTAIDISLNGWKINTLNGGKTFALPEVKLKPGERIVLYGKQTNLLLSDGGETVRLVNSSGKIYDAFTYNLARAEDASFCRLPDGAPGDSWFEDCTPTPNLINTREGKAPTSPDGAASIFCNLPDTIPVEFFIPECHGYGADIWNPFYWDFVNWIDKLWIQQANEKWRTFIE